MNTNEDINLLIGRYFSGETTGEEKQTIDNWLKADARNRKLFNDLNEIWLSSGVANNADQYDVEKAILKFKARARATAGNMAAGKHVIRLLQYAAIVVLALALPFVYYLGKKSSVADSYTTVTCPPGDKTSVVLPDSSTVFLNSGSQLMFSNNFKNGARRLFLDGEAYFSVKKDPDNPFRVKTSDVEIEVLGTEFNLKAYSDERKITATLVTGSLKVSDKQNSTIIKPNQKLTFSKETQEMSVQEIDDLSPETDWKEGRLVFRNQSLGELEHTLERWFDVEVEFADDLVKTRRFTGTLEHESILEVITYFDRSKYVSYTINNNVITFYSEP